eukprot:CAMPEP_0119182910 /NCGR_PEP_ID=MMETSP1315-20130426/62982_1 /TAXON_ID=676789 /ORGANISM="Prasinoderma singularis, Strain RCC927" /LENGTH=48 /DNA_ID= /DNA_START= /DNA_END= /DNA_ORIENTATION=
MGVFDTSTAAFSAVPPLPTSQHGAHSAHSSSRASSRRLTPQMPRRGHT